MEESRHYNSGYSISVILPVYNEGRNIDKIIGDANNFFSAQKEIKDYEIIVVDDGSDDSTAERLKKIMDEAPFLRSIRHAKNLGYGKALISGMRVSQYPLVFFMDADGQFDIAELEKMVPLTEDFDIIIGYRKKRQDSFCRILLAKIYSWVVFLFFGLKFKDINCGFKLFKREAVNDEVINSHGGVFYTELFLKVRNNGYKIKEIPVTHYPRLTGRQTGASLKVIWNAITDIIKLKMQNPC